jgi:hypothetical protein
LTGRFWLAAHGFAQGTVFFRDQGETYADVVRRSGADVLVEDDCESIGGTRQTAASGLSRTTGCTVRCIVVPEFGGVAHLPDDSVELARL